MLGFFLTEISLNCSLLKGEQYQELKKLKHLLSSNQITLKRPPVAVPLTGAS